MQVVEVFQSLLLWTCESGHHIFWCVCVCVWRRYIRNRHCACLCFFRMFKESASWMIATGWLTESLIVFGSRVSPVIAGGACFDSPWTLTLRAEWRPQIAILCGRVLLQSNRFRSCCYPVPKVVPLRWPWLGNFKFDRCLTWPNFACRGQAGVPSWEWIWLANNCIDDHRWIWMDYDGCRSFCKMSDDTKTESAETI